MRSRFISITLVFVAALPTAHAESTSCETRFARSWTGWITRGLRQKNLDRARTDLQRQAVQSLLDRGTLKNSTYDVALTLGSQEQKNIFLKMVDLEQAKKIDFGLDYWRQLKSLQAPRQSALFENLIDVGKPDLSAKDIEFVLSADTDELFHAHQFGLKKAASEPNHPVLDEVLRARAMTATAEKRDPEAFQSLLAWNGLPPSQQKFVTLLHRRYFKDPEVRFLAEKIAHEGRFSWRSGPLTAEYSIASYDHRLIVKIPSINSNKGQLKYGDETENLNTATGKLLYATLLGIGKALERHPEIADVQIHAQNILNKKLIGTLKSFGFYQQNRIDASKFYEEIWDTTQGEFLGMNLYSTQRTLQPADVKAMVLSRLKSFPHDLGNWQEVPDQAFNIHVYQAVKVLTENAFPTRSNIQPLLRLSNPFQVTAIEKIVDNPANQARLGNLLEQITAKVHDQESLEQFMAQL